MRATRSERGAEHGSGHGSGGARRRRRQAALPFGNGWGGARRGAGRRPRGARAGVPHRVRAHRTGREPVHITLKLRPGLPRLRTRTALAVLWRCFERGRDRFGFRLVQFSVQRDHLHLIAEAPDCRCLARGMQGLAVRVARNLNRSWGRRGTVFADRYHDQVLRTPRQVRAALCYVLNNALHHGLRFRWRDATVGAAAMPTTPAGGGIVDPCSSARWFDGWRPPGAGPPPAAPPPTVGPRTWLLRHGWRRHGLIGTAEVPGPRRV